MIVTELEDWFQVITTHVPRESVRPRARYERQRREKEALRNTVISRLTPEERAVLGLA